MGKSLRFREDGTFTIAQFTDIHWKDGSSKDQQSRAVMDTVLDMEQPDLVVFTGDTIYTGYISPGETECKDPYRALREAVDAAESRGIPWAYVFGNHDTESLVTREQLMELILEHPNTVSESGPANLEGAGNYKLEVTDREGNPAAALYFLDSGNRSPIPSVQGFNWIRREQIDWYVRSSLDLPQLPDGRHIPALAFFHIPFPEFNEVWNTQVCYGHKFEEVCCPQLNSGLFASMVEMGNMLGAFVGHDHINDYWGELHGIRLCYGRATGHHTYGRDGFPRGSRIIRLHAGERRLDTWLRLEDRTVIRNQPEHKPEGE
jgi:hypothetical protein